MPTKAKLACASQLVKCDYNMSVHPSAKGFLGGTGYPRTHSSMRVQIYHDFASLPSEYDHLFEQAGRKDFCLTRTLFETFAGHAIDCPERLRLIGVEEEGQAPRALIVARYRERAGAPRTLFSLSNYYSMVFQPMVAEGAVSGDVLGALLKEVCAETPRYDLLRFQPLDRESPLFGQFQEALRGSGLVVQPYFHFGNWYEDIDALSSQDYLARRPTVLRNTLRRKGGKLERRGGARFELIIGGAALERAMADYEQVYAASWKKSEPHPGFIRDLVSGAAGAGALRMGFLHLDGQAAAAQIWIVWRRRATIYKMAHDARFDSLSLGTLLTWRMMERMIDEERVAQVDFGPGDDPFKRAWMSRRRERWGLVAFDPRTLRGAAGALRHVVGRRVKRGMLGRVPIKIRGRLAADDY